MPHSWGTCDVSIPVSNTKYSPCLYSVIVEALWLMCVSLRMDEGADMHSLLMTDNHCLLIGGLQNYVVEFDLNTVQEAQKVWEICFFLFAYPYISRPGGQRITHQVTCGLFSSDAFLTVHCWSSRCGNIATNQSTLLLRTHFWQSMLDLIELAKVKKDMCSTNSHSMWKQITLRDLRTFKMEHEFDAFSGSLSDFDVHGNLLAACGFSSRGLNGLSCDRFLMVYDLRMMRAVTPLQVHVDPLFLRFIPTYTSRLAIISQTGISWASWGCFHCVSVINIFHLSITF